MTEAAFSFWNDYRGRDGGWKGFSTNSSLIPKLRAAAESPWSVHQAQGKGSVLRSTKGCISFPSQRGKKKKKQFGGPFYIESVKIIRGEDKLPGTRLHEVMESQVRQSSKAQW